MARSNFFSVERKGYIKVSDLFYDVMQDMLEHGFTFVNCSNALKDKPVTYWQPTIVTSAINGFIGQKLYIHDGDRPTYSGVSKLPPYVTVTSISPGTGSSGGFMATSLSDVIADYDFPIWTSAVLSDSNISLSTSQTTFVDSGVVINLANIAAQSNRSSTTANVSYAPSNFSFTLEAGGDVDLLNGEIDPNSIVGAALPESNRQAWRVQFVISEEQKASAAVATSLQMFYDEPAGRIKVSQITDDFGNVIDNVGVTGAQQVEGRFVETDLNQGIYNRKIRVSTQPQTFPLSYVLSITNRGFFLGIYEGSWSTTRAASSSNSNYFNWILVQRPVDRGTGRPLTAGKAPVFHINSVNYKYYKAVVRESDVLHPTAGANPVLGKGIITTTADAIKVDSAPSLWKISGAEPGDETDFLKTLEPGWTIYDSKGYAIGVVLSITSNTELLLTTRPTKLFDKAARVQYYYMPGDATPLRVLADVHSPDSHAIFNSLEQVSLTEDKTYLLSFPHNLTTPRFRYTEELDMLGTTSSDVVMTGQDIQFKTYGEVGPRTYRALPANGALNTGLRLAVLWAPQGPRWTGPNGEVSPTDLGQITAGSQPGTVLTANPVPMGFTEESRALPTFRLERGSLPSGLSVEQIGDQWQIRGTVNFADYIENTIIKFTLAAVNQEDSGYSLKDFYFTYII